MFAIERLMREGVRGDTARDLVVSHGAERCLRYAEALDAQEGIRKGYALPEPPEPALETSQIADSPRSEKRSRTASSPPLPHRRTRPPRSSGTASSSTPRKR